MRVWNLVVTSNISIEQAIKVESGISRLWRGLLHCDFYKNLVRGNFIFLRPTLASPQLWSNISCSCYTASHFAWLCSNLIFFGSSWRRSAYSISVSRRSVLSLSSQRAALLNDERGNTFLRTLGCNFTCVKGSLCVNK